MTNKQQQKEQRNLTRAKLMVAFEEILEKENPEAFVKLKKENQETSSRFV